MRQKYILVNFNLGVKSMLLTKDIIKFNKLLIEVPKSNKRLWDMSENRWGYKIVQK